MSEKLNSEGEEEDFFENPLTTTRRSLLCEGRERNRTFPDKETVNACLKLYGLHVSSFLRVSHLRKEKKNYV